MTECENLIKQIVSTIENSPNWESWIQFCLTFLAIIVALFGREFVEWLKRPKIELVFDKNNQSYFHEIDFFLFKHGNNEHFAKGINCLLKISNPQKRRLFLQTQTAKYIEAKITFIYEGNKKFTYHPTNLNWSGTRGKTNKVDIISGSHHFLDFINILNYDNHFWINDPENLGERKKSAITPDQGPAEFRTNRINFRPWTVGDYGGLPKMFNSDNTYKIHFVIDGENCSPHKYVATIIWEKSNWKNPDIKIEVEK